MGRALTVFVVLASTALSAAAQKEIQPASADRGAPDAAIPAEVRGAGDDARGAGNNTGAPPNGAGQADVRKNDRLFGVLPNYATVEGTAKIGSVTNRQTFQMAALNSFDPVVYPFVGVMAGLGQKGGLSYGKRYATAMADNSIGNVLTSAVLPTLLHQDPRYFELGDRGGGLLRRARYALTRSVVTRSRSGQAQFNYSEIGGNAIAAGLSNFYYTSSDRTATGTLTRWGMQVMWDTLSNEMKEFWPDIRRRIHRR
jgi:hypothetical protein